MAEFDRPKSGRIVFLDVARGIGIFFVVLGHNLWSGSWGAAAIFNFHMPLFYFLSGLFFSPEKTWSWSDIRRRILFILEPVPVFALLGCLVFIVEPQLAEAVSRKVLYGLFVHGEPWYDRPVWFFTSLAGVVFVFSFASRLLSGRHRTIRRIVFLALCIGLSFAATSTPPSFRAILSPAMATTIPFGLFWYALGHFSRERVFRLESLRSAAIPLLLLAAAFALPVILGTDVSLKPDIRTARMGSWRLFPLSLCGIASILFAARSIPGRFAAPLVFVGRHSIAFFALEFTTFPYVAKALGHLVPNYRHFEIAECIPLWQSLAAVSAQLAVLSLLAPTVTRLLSRFRNLANAPARGHRPASALLGRNDNLEQSPEIRK